MARSRRGRYGAVAAGSRRSGGRPPGTRAPPSRPSPSSRSSRYERHVSAETPLLLALEVRGGPEHAVAALEVNQRAEHVEEAVARAQPRELQVCPGVGGNRPAPGRLTIAPISTSASTARRPAEHAPRIGEELRQQPVVGARSSPRAAPRPRRRRRHRRIHQHAPTPPGLRRPHGPRGWRGACRVLERLTDRVDAEPLGCRPAARTGRDGSARPSPLGADAGRRIT